MSSTKEYASGRRAERQAIVDEAKRVPCPDCKRRYPSWCMDFDHVTGEKEDSIGRLVGNGAPLEALFDELSKCEAVCSNCHRNRTHERRKAAGEKVAEE